MCWRTQVRSGGERLDFKASSEPTKGCDYVTLFSTQCHFTFNYTSSQMAYPTEANLPQRVYLIPRNRREFVKQLQVLCSALKFTLILERTDLHTIQYLQK